MKEGLEQVKSELGAEAVILSAKSIKPARGLWGGKQPLVEIVAARDRSEERESQSETDNAWTRLSQLDPIREDIRDLKNTMCHLAFPRVTLPPTFDRVFQEMVFQGVRDELALRLTLDVVEGLKCSDGAPTPERTAVIESMVERFPRSGPIRLEDSRKPEIVALVGPTGVGKTTTLAKLAAHFSVRMRQRVAVLTIDSYRIAAIEQLRVYGKIMGLSVDVVERSEEMEEALRRHKDVDLVLIDTAGQSHRNRLRIQELKRFFDGFPVAKHLVLSCHTREREMEEIVSRFKCLDLDRLIFTKLDEATTFGTMVNMYHLTDLPISYLTIGQKVPEDIREATPKIIADLVFSMTPLRAAKRDIPGERRFGWG
jgi:flagellar biosynthesis protein FlhF